MKKIKNVVIIAFLILTCNLVMADTSNPAPYIVYWTGEVSRDVGRTAYLSATVEGTTPQLTIYLHVVEIDLTSTYVVNNQVRPKYKLRYNSGSLDKTAVLEIRSVKLNDAANYYFSFYNSYGQDGVTMYLDVIP